MKGSATGAVDISVQVRYSDRDFKIVLLFWIWKLFKYNENDNNKNIVWKTGCDLPVSYYSIWCSQLYEYIIANLTQYLYITL